MEGSSSKSAGDREPEDTDNIARGSSSIAKKRKKDALKPIITTEAQQAQE